jgi:hypothetical protein
MVPQIVAPERDIGATTLVPEHVERCDVPWCAAKRCRPPHR